MYTKYRTTKETTIAAGWRIARPKRSAVGEEGGSESKAVMFNGPDLESGTSGNDGPADGSTTSVFVDAARRSKRRRRGLPTSGEDGHRSTRPLVLTTPPAQHTLGKGGAVAMNASAVLMTKSHSIAC